MTSSLASVLTPERILFLPVLWISLICHEVGHAYAAYLAGDDTARLQGRLSFNPLHHMDPVGTVVIPILQIFVGIPLIGWAKPVPINPARFRAGYWRIVVALAGVTMNLTLLATSLIVYKVAIVAGWVPGVESLQRGAPAPEGPGAMVALVLQLGILLNLSLTLFNLLPIPPLDGSHIFLYFIRTRDSVAFYIFAFLERFGFIILLLLVFTRTIGQILWPILESAYFAMSYVSGIPIYLLFPRNL